MTRHYQGNNTDFINIVVFGKYADAISENLKKGLLVAVSGRIQNSAYDDNGVKRYKLEVVAEDIQFLSKPHSTSK